MEFKREKKVKTEFLESDLLKYYTSISLKPKLKIEASSVENGLFVLDMTNLILLFVYERYKLTKWIDLEVLILPAGSRYSNTIEVEYKSSLLDESQFECTSLVGIKNDSSLSDINLCKRPMVLVSQKSLIISGLSSTLRFLLKYCSVVGVELKGCDESENKILRHEMLMLLGFRSGCLQACAEASVWTRFCEVDMTERMILALVKAVNWSVWPKSDWEFELPQDLLRFEYHLTQPVRIHNFRKRVQRQERLIRLNGSPERSKHAIPSSAHSNNDIRQESTTETIHQLSHDYAEGPDITIADIVLFPCVDLAKRLLGDVFQTYLPNLLAWHHRLEIIWKDTPLKIRLPRQSPPSSLSDSCVLPKITLPPVLEESLYKSDSSRHNPKLRQYTRQDDIETAMEIIRVSGIEPMEPRFPCKMGEFLEPLVDWGTLPLLLHPEEGGQLPRRRIERKCHQLANLLQMVQFIYGEKKRGSASDDSRGCLEPSLKIVDFCSGGGHVGILLAWLFPHCRVILVENKEESLRRAQVRVEKLKLSNISVFQCNLNSFDGHFDIGVALHACGCAADLVLEKCLRTKASFVVCPCCYGAIQNNHLLHYPRSSTFHESELKFDQYLVIAHTADQTHDEKNHKTNQGRFSMRIIDTDRLLYFQERGYRTWLGKINPETASPKNHILVGIHM